MWVFRDLGVWSWKYVESLRGRPHLCIDPAAVRKFKYIIDVIPLSVFYVDRPVFRSAETPTLQQVNEKVKDI